MSPFNLQTCAQRNILSLEPYCSEEKRHLCNLRNDHSCTQKTITADNVYVGAGASEVIDVLIRCFAVPGDDKTLICPPTYEIFSVSAHVNDVGIVEAPLLPAPGFGLDVESISAALSQEPNIKLVFLVSPNNPTGTIIPKEDLAKILEHPTWNGVVVLDKAYIDYSSKTSSRAEWITEWPNLVVVQTLSKAFGTAGIRSGAAFASPPIVQLLNNLSATYNIPGPTSKLACYALSAGLDVMQRNRAKMEVQRNRLLHELPKLPGVGRLRGGTESNFLLFEILDRNGKPDNSTARAVCEILAEEGDILVRFRGTHHGCLRCIRITIGIESEITQLLTGSFEDGIERGK
ncbi:PLP-dependent transferase [Acephala macrosclerotiorum]|nr:PLP-dependent transferase [Acephala macrosclerotiorum]